MTFKKRKRMAGTRFRKQQLRQTGLNPRSGDMCKRYQKIVIKPSRTSRTLYSNVINDIPGPNAATNGGAASGLIDARERGTAYIRGISLRFYARSLDSTRGKAMMHMAILSSKNANDTTVAVDGFFRDFDNSRDINFGAAVSGISMAHNPINTDKWNVIRHHRWNLAQSNNFTYRDSKMHTQYIKINRLFSYNDDSNSNPEQPLHLVYWFSYYFASPSEVGVDNSFQVAWKAVVYYTDNA